ncbi:hypothetical protein HCN44_011086 [Aphidius gifuensis]|uniref:Vesicle transport protein USE1 n=1 Tax=Aphidius gifuensis TaxID=684658 RepID=A0A834XY74_APHGI|nr:hypothetical protein HCN44_011086 [Aphidius gifuensis]
MSRLEVNVRRLLAKCELMAKEDVSENWRLEKYVLALDELVKKLNDDLIDKPAKDTISEYIKRTKFLKGIIETAKLSSPIERIAATQMLSKTSSSSLSSISNDNNNTSSITTQIHQKTSAKYNKELRAELFNSNSSKDGLKQRLLSPSSNQDDDLNSILKYNNDMQEKIAENMMMMTSSMKEHALTANAFITKDVNKLIKSDELTDKNTEKLKNETLRLEEHTKSQWRCWVWIMVVFVLTVFFSKYLYIDLYCNKY